MTWGEFEGESALRSICFHTNLTVYGPFGLNEEGTSVSIPMEGGVIVGFHGRAGNFLNAIGVYVAPKTRSFCPFQDSGNVSTHNEDMMSSMNLVVPRDPGPWGASGGKHWDDGVFSAIKKVHLNNATPGSYALLAVQFQYEKADGKCFWLPWHGNDGFLSLKVFNTYGYVVNAALLHRYGFAEVDNPYDIVKIDLELVVQWSSSLFSGRHSRMRLSLWRRLHYGGCVSQNSKYFEISSNGEPQVELLILLYIMLLPEEPYGQLDLTVSTSGSLNESLSLILLGHGKIETEEVPETFKDLLLTKSVCKALLAIANIRESFYGSNSFEDDIEALRSCPLGERKLYHSLMLRTSERRILQKLRAYATAAGPPLFIGVVRKKLKRT